jgi:serine/threonine-protein kinase RIM15
MPFSQAPTEQATPNSSSPKASNRRLSRHLDSMSIEPPVDPFVSTLHDLIAVCTDILEMSASTLTSRPGMGSDLVRKVQEVGRAWDAHPDWYGRTWYITVLLAVATLARVIEWFEAERQFWNFEDDDEEGEAEPLTFVLKPEFDGEGRISGRGSRERKESFSMTPVAGRFAMDETGGTKRSREASENDDEARMTRDERVPQKDLRGALVGDQGIVTQDGSGQVTPPVDHQPSDDQLQRQPSQQHPAHPQPVHDAPSSGLAESTRMEASEHLRQKAEKAKSSNILMELNLDGEHFLYINRTWVDVIG